MYDDEYRPPSVPDQDLRTWEEVLAPDEFPLPTEGFWHVFSSAGDDDYHIAGPIPAGKLAETLRANEPYTCWHILFLAPDDLVRRRGPGPYDYDIIQED